MRYVGAAAADHAEEKTMSLEGWAALPEDEPGELVDGRLVEEEIPDAVHETIIAWLIQVLRNWLPPRGGFVLGSELKLAVRPRRGRKADLTVFLPGGAVPRRRGVIRTPPDIAVEVVSRSPRDVRRDRVEKADEYAAFGVRYYWLLDPEARMLEVFELEAVGRYGRALGATDGVVETVPGCEGLKLDLSALWAEVDRLGPEDEGNEVDVSGDGPSS
jgi:Uma2 family endonuclease